MLVLSSGNVEKRTNNNILIIGGDKVKKKWSKALSFLIASGMIITSSIGVNAKTFDVDGKDKQNLRQQQPKEESYVEGEVIVLYKDTATNAKAFQSGKDLLKDVEIVETYDFDSAEAKGKAGVRANNASVNQKADFKVSLLKSDKLSTKELIKQLESDSRIQAVQPNYKIHLTGTDDAYSKYQWALDNVGQNGGTEGADVKVSALEKNPDSKDERVIALVDTGIDYEHEDLKDVVWNNPYQSKAFKGEHGYDFINKDDDPLDAQVHIQH